MCTSVGRQHLCDTLKLLLEEETKQLGVRTHIRTNEKEFDCFIQDISHFLQVRIIHITELLRMRETVVVIS